MKKSIILAIIALVLLVCVSCGQGLANDTDTTDNNMQDTNDLTDSAQARIDTEEYSIIEKNGKHYIVFTNYDNYGDSDVATVDFDTIKEFKDSVTKGELADYEKATIVTAFKRDENGILSCNFNKLYEPVLPLGGTVTSVSWAGDCYSFCVEFSNVAWGFVNYYSAEAYNEIYQRNYENYFNKDTITVTSTEQIDNGQKVVTYYNGHFMNVRYTLQNGTKTVVVDKMYELNNENETIATSSSVPQRIALYCIDGEVYYGIDLHNLSEAPSDEWLMQFGMAQYGNNN